MCGRSEAEVGYDAGMIEIGHYGGSIGVKDKKYCFDHNDGWVEGSRQELITALCKYERHDLVIFIVDLIENAQGG